jgi:hypothetical protein
MVWLLVALAGLDLDPHFLVCRAALAAELLALEHAWVVCAPLRSQLEGYLLQVAVGQG